MEAGWEQAHRTQGTQIFWRSWSWGELYPQKTEVHYKIGRWGNKVTQAESPLLLLPRSTVYRGCEQSGCEDEFKGDREGFVMKAELIKLPGLRWDGVM